MTATTTHVADCECDVCMPPCPVCGSKYTEQQTDDSWICLPCNDGEVASVATLVTDLAHYPALAFAIGARGARSVDAPDDPNVNHDDGDHDADCNCHACLMRRASALRRKGV